MFIRTILLAACTTALLNVNAQSHTDTSAIRTMFYGGAGLVVPGSAMKEQSMIGTGPDFRFGIFQSFYKHQSPKLSYQIGLELRLSYAKFAYELSTPSSLDAIRYNNGTGTPAQIMLREDHKAKKPDAFHYLIGPAVNFYSGKTFFGASLLFGYSSFAQEAFRFHDTIRNTANPAQNRNIDFYSASHETNNKFTFSPGIKAGYRFTKNLAFFLAADFSMGGTHDFEDRLFTPAGNPTNGVYDFNQLANGTIVPYQRHSDLRLLSFSGNLALTLPYRR